MEAMAAAPLVEGVTRGRVWFMILGSRGDTQPFIALARALSKAGYSVRIFAPRDLSMVNGEKQGTVAELVKSCGIDCVECQDDKYCEQLASLDSLWLSEADAVGEQYEAFRSKFRFMAIETISWLNLRTYETCENLFEAAKICEARTKMFQDPLSTDLSMREYLQQLRDANEEVIAFQADDAGMTVEEYRPLREQRKQAWFDKLPGSMSGVPERQARYVTHLDRLARSLIDEGTSDVDVLKAMAKEQRDWLSWQMGRDLEDYRRAWDRKLNPSSLGPGKIQGYAPGERPSDAEAQLMFEELRAAHYEEQPCWPLVHEAVDRDGFHCMIRATIPRMAELAVQQAEALETRPDLVIYNELAMNAGLMMWSRYGVDTLYTSLQWSLPERPADIEARSANYLDMDFWIQRVAGVSPVRNLGMEGHYRLIVNPRQLAAYTCLLVPNLEGLEAADPGARLRRDRLRRNCMGAWVVGAEDQLNIGDAKSFGGEEAKAKVLEFLEAGEAPVYIGWGSMQYPHGGGKLTKLVVRSLQMAGLRGIFCSGWSGGGLEALRKELGDEDRDNLVAYSESCVLFLKAAPHAWLFSRCSATVHHGGAGTTNAALHSGVPTIIAPVFGDQFMYGPWVQDLGCGKCISALASLHASELSSALLEVLSDETMKQTANGVAQMMREEAGVRGAVAMVDKVFSNEIRSGAVAEMWKARKKTEYFAAASSQAGVPAEPWQCIICTMVNQGSSYICEACEAPWPARDEAGQGVPNGYHEAMAAVQRGHLEQFQADMQHLQDEMGFSKEQVTAAFQFCSTAEEAIEFILSQS